VTAPLLLALNQEQNFERSGVSKMAVVLPFAAWRYNTSKAGPLEKLVTQPYDKISPEMQRAYLESSPYNYAHLIKGESRGTDTASENVYTRAAQWLQQWREAGVLTHSGRPAFYAYYQQFTLPGAPSGSPTMVRKAFIGMGKLEPYDGGIIFRHEKTHAAAKADRLELLRKTRAHLESIFLLYSDPERRIEAILDCEAKHTPAAQVTDEYGVVHSLWEVADPLLVKSLTDAMAEKNLIIADGHHRYDTAMTFERECRATHPGEDADCSLVLMTFVNMDGDGLVILPTHRVISGVDGWSAQRFLEASSKYFTVSRFPFSDETSRQRALEQMQAAMNAARTTAIGALFQNDSAFYCLTQRADVDWPKLLPDLTEAERSLDVTILHRIALGLCLGLDEAAVAREKHLDYVRHFEEGVASVIKGSAQGCFFLNPAKITQVRDIAFSGRVLPQKSTDFYPKLLSGLVLYPLNH
jgi:uncharacterized protein (DUF1015 family)